MKEERNGLKKMVRRAMERTGIKKGFDQAGGRVSICRFVDLSIEGLEKKQRERRHVGVVSLLFAQGGGGV